jgi:hypothetical protein
MVGDFFNSFHGVIFLGLVWFGLVWFGLVWCGCLNFVLVVGRVFPSGIVGLHLDVAEELRVMPLTSPNEDSERGCGYERATEKSED